MMSYHEMKSYVIQYNSMRSYIIKPHDMNFNEILCYKLGFDLIS